MCETFKQNTQNVSTKTTFHISILELNFDMPDTQNFIRLILFPHTCIQF